MTQGCTGVCSWLSAMLSWMPRCRGKGAGRLRCQGPWLPEGCLVSASARQRLPAELLELQTHLPASAAKQEPASPSISLRASECPHRARARQPGVGKAPTASGRGREGTKGSGTDPREGKGRLCVCVGKNTGFYLKGKK